MIIHVVKVLISPFLFLTPQHVGVFQVVILKVFSPPPPFIPSVTVDL